VDVPRKRIALTCRLDDAAPRPALPGRDAAPRTDTGERPARRGAGARAHATAAPKPQPAPANNALADAFARAKRH
jgi:uncharacterized protein